MGDDERLNARVRFLMTMDEGPEREAMAREFRRQLGTESRFSASGNGKLARFWNWFIDADQTRMAFPPMVPIVLGLIVSALVGILFLVY